MIFDTNRIIVKAIIWLCFDHSLEKDYTIGLREEQLGRWQLQMFLNISAGY